MKVKEIENVDIWCPNCGFSHGILMRKIVSDMVSFFVECPKCHSQTVAAMDDTKLDAIDKWESGHTIILEGNNESKL